MALCVSNGATQDPHVGIRDPVSKIYFMLHARASKRIFKKEREGPKKRQRLSIDQLEKKAEGFEKLPTVKELLLEDYRKNKGLPQPVGGNEIKELEEMLEKGEL